MSFQLLREVIQILRFDLLIEILGLQHDDVLMIPARRHRELFIALELVCVKVEITFCSFYFAG